MATEIKMPQLGLTMEEGTVERWLKAEGDPVKAGEPLLEITTDKLTNEVVAMRAENAYIPQEIKGVKLTDQEINDLREGKKVFIEGMIPITARSSTPTSRSTPNAGASNTSSRMTNSSTDSRWAEWNLPSSRLKTSMRARPSSWRGWSARMVSCSPRTSSWTKPREDPPTHATIPIPRRERVKSTSRMK